MKPLKYGMKLKMIMAKKFKDLFRFVLIKTFQNQKNFFKITKIYNKKQNLLLIKLLFVLTTKIEYYKKIINMNKIKLNNNNTRYSNYNLKHFLKIIMNKV